MRRHVASGLFLVALTACGTTVPASQQLVQAGSDGIGSTVDGTLDPGSAPQADGRDVSGVGPAAAAGTTRSDGATATVTGTAGPGAPGSGARPAVEVPRGGSVVVGFATSKGGAAAASAVGISGATTGDQENQVRAVIGTINARGGILGRKVVPAPYDIDTVEASSNPAAVDTASCTFWQEKKAFVVVNVTARPTLRACLAKAGIPLISSISIDSPASVYRDQLPGVYGPSAMSIDRSVRAVVDRLVARGFFTGWNPETGQPGPNPVKIGMQSFDDADGKHVVDVTRKALAAHGLEVDLLEAHSTNVNDNASSTSAAVLQFRSRGITHVIDANLIFFQTAASQNYRPRYMIQDKINTPALLAQNVPASQLHGAMGAGFLPFYEVENAAPVSAEATRCEALMRKAGEDTSQTIAFGLMLHACDAIYFLEKALTAGGTVSVTGLRTGATRLGSVPSHLTYGSLVTTSRRDGASRIRDFDYVDACSCFQHPSTTTYAVP